MIYLCANTKGGVGKSTLSVHLAAWLAYRGKTLLIDTDKQATAASWAGWRRDRAMDCNPDTIMLRNKLVADEGKALALNYENTVIDAGGKDNPGLRYAMLIADKLIVPMSHSDFDTAAWDDMEELIEGSQIGNPTLQVRIVLARIHTGRKNPTDVVDFLHERGYQLYNTIIPERVAYVRANNDGIAVFERRPSSPEARAMESLFEEIVNDKGA